MRIGLHHRALAARGHGAVRRGIVRFRNIPARAGTPHQFAFASAMLWGPGTLHRFGTALSPDSAFAQPTSSGHYALRVKGTPLAHTDGSSFGGLVHHLAGVPVFATLRRYSGAIRHRFNQGEDLTECRPLPDTP